MSARSDTIHGYAESGRRQEVTVDWYLISAGTCWVIAQWVYAVFGWAVPGLVKKP